MLVAICQTDILLGDARYNLIAAEDFIVRAAKEGAKLVLFPELSMTGYAEGLTELAEDENGNICSTMKEYAVRYDIAIGFGYVGKVNEKISNRYVVVDQSGAVISDYAKIHPFTYTGEDKIYTSGEEVVTFELEGVRFATFICYDLRFPVLFESVAKDVDAIIVPANWGGERDEQWRVLLRARAIENQTYVLGVNRVGTDNSMHYVGSSMAVGPKGEIIDVLGNGQGYMITEIDTEYVAKWRQKFPVLADHRTDFYKRIL